MVAVLWLAAVVAPAVPLVVTVMVSVESRFGTVALNTVAIKVVDA